MARVERQRHFVLVHGACHGAWCWYKLKPRLKDAGHRVTTLDLTASGINRMSIEDVHSFHEYSAPLLEILASLPQDEKVVLVGHSLGGLSVALAMDNFPEKISVAVFLTAFMPDTTNPPSYVVDQYVARTPAEAWLDTQFAPCGNSECDQPLMTMFFGPKFLSLKAYQLSPVEDLELAKVLVRPSSLFLSDLAKAKKFSDKGYGAVPRAYVLCDEDEAIPIEFQRWMIQNNPVQDILEITGADHMPMFSMTQQLCDFLLEIAHKHS